MHNSIPGAPFQALAVCAFLAAQAWKPLVTALPTLLGTGLTALVTWKVATHRINEDKKFWFKNQTYSKVSEAYLETLSMMSRALEQMSEAEINYLFTFENKKEQQITSLIATQVDHNKLEAVSRVYGDAKFIAVVEQFAGNRDAWFKELTWLLDPTFALIKGEERKSRIAMWKQARVDAKEIFNRAIEIAREELRPDAKALNEVGNNK